MRFPLKSLVCAVVRWGVIGTFVIIGYFGWKIITALVGFVTLWHFAQTFRSKRSKRLTRVITVAQVESEHPDIGENCQWRGLLGKMREEDVLMKFVRPGQQGCDVGVAIVRAGKIADSFVVVKGKKRKTKPFVCLCAGRPISQGNVRRSRSLL